MSKCRPLPPQEYLHDHFDYDAETGLFLRLRRWGSEKNGGVSTGRTDKDDGYVRISIRSKDYLAHRLVWKYVHGEEPALLDHINGNRSDNRLANIRVATCRQNCQNSVGWSATLPKGVAKVSCRKESYQAMIRIDGKPTYLGCFPTPEEAHEAYAKAALTHFGEFARLS